MKKGNFRLLIVFVFILFLGVGYAVVSSVGLSIAGSSSVADEDLDVVFTGDYSVSNTSKGSATVVADGRTATFEVSDMALNQTVSFDYYVKNKETDVAANVSIVSTGSNDYYSITTTEINSSSSSFVLEPNHSTQVKVSVKMIKTPILESDNIADFTVTLSAVPSETDAVQVIYFGYRNQRFSVLEGMTWKEFVASEYNTSNFTIDGDLVCYGSYYITEYEGGDVVSADDVITSEREYWRISIDSYLGNDSV